MPAYPAATPQLRFVSQTSASTPDAVLVAALCRGLVETAARAWAAAEPVPAVPTALLRLATWQAGRYGLHGRLLDPVTTATARSRRCEATV